MIRDEEFTILLVDDSRFNLEILNHILNSEYSIIIAKTGREALEKAAGEKPDLILLDIVMPDISGYEVLVALKGNDDMRDIPVIFITGLKSDEDEEKGFRLGAVDYITRPFNHAIVKARVATHIKIVQQMRAIEQIGKLDGLTQISNRRGFDEHLLMEWSRAIREQEPLSVLILDVDKFKTYNDTYGHLQGDKMLKSLAKVLKIALKRATDFAARYGGEEFVAVLSNTPLKGALLIAERIRNGMEKMIVPDIDGNPTSATVSIGVACSIPTKDDDMSAFLERADRALYRAKETGRNKVVFSEE